MIASPIIAHMADKPCLLVVTAANDPGQMSVATAQLDPQDGIEVSDVREAETMLFQMAQPAQEPVTIRMVPYAIRRQAAYVAARTRRGYGNYMLCHPFFAEILPDEQVAPYDEALDGPRECGRWQQQGILIKSGPRGGSTIWTSEELALDECYVGYIGSQPYDAPAVLATAQDGSLRFCTGRHPRLVPWHGTHNYITKIAWS